MGYRVDYSLFTRMEKYFIINSWRKTQVKEQFLNAYGFEKPEIRRVSSPLLERKEEKQD